MRTAAKQKVKREHLAFLPSLSLYNRARHQPAVSASCPVAGTWPTTYNGAGAAYLNRVYSGALVNNACEIVVAANTFGAGQASINPLQPDSTNTVYMENEVTVAVGATMTLPSGATLKETISTCNTFTVNGTFNVSADATVRMHQGTGCGNLHVFGTLNGNGTVDGSNVLHPATFTSLDPATYWYGLSFESGSSGTLNHTIISLGSQTYCGGNAPYAMLVICGGSPTIKNSFIQNANTDGLGVVGNLTPVLSGDSFLNNHGYAITFSTPPTSINATGLTASGNLSGNVAIIFGGGYSGTGTWTNLGIPLAISGYANLTIPAASSLTLNPGFTLIGSTYRLVDVSGTFNVGAPSPAAPVTLEPFDGGSWEGITYESGSSGVVNNVQESTYTPFGGYGIVDKGATSLQVLNSTFSHCLDGVFVTAGSPILTNDSFDHSVSFAVEFSDVPTSATLNNLTNLHGAEATEALVIQGGTYAGTWNNTGIPYYVDSYYSGTGSVTVAAATTLTIAPGVTIELANTPFRVDGTLVANGTDDTAAGRITFTSQNVVSPQPGNAGDLIFAKNSTASLTYVHVNYGAGGGTCCSNNNVSHQTAILIYDASVSITHSTIDHAGGDGIEIAGDTTSPTPTLSNDTFTNNAWNAVSYSLIPSTMAHMTNLSASGNGGYNSVQSALGNVVAITGGTIPATLSLSDTGIPYYWDGNNVTVAVGATLAIPAGVSYLGNGDLTVNGGLTAGAGSAMKFTGGRIVSNGTMTMTGTAAQPISLTSGRASPTLNDWSGIWFEPGSTDTLQYVHVLHAGFFGLAVYIATPGVSMTHSAILSNGGDDVYAVCAATSDNLQNDVFGTVPAGYVGIHTDCVNSPGIDASCSFWQSPAGPTNSANPGGDGVPVDAGVTFAPWRVTDPAVTVPTLAAVPSSAPGGSSIGVFGGNFTAGHSVNLYLDSTGSVPFATVPVNTCGCLVSSYAIPAGTFGTHTLIARDTVTTTTASTTIHVMPRITATPTHAPANAGFSLSGSGFQPNETVTVKWNCGAAGCSSPITLGTPTADGNGVISLSHLNVPAFSPGAYPVGAAGNTSHAFASTPFTVDAPPVVSVSPSQAPAFANATVNGSGFEPGEALTIKWNCATPTCSAPITLLPGAMGTTSQVTSLATVTVNGGGSFSEPFVVPNFSPGTYPIAVIGNTDATFVKVNFTVTVPATLSATPAHAPGLAQAQVSGTGFQPNETVTVKWNCGSLGCTSTNILLPGGGTGESVTRLGTATADGSGNFTKIFTVPNFSAGTYPIGAIGSSSNSFARTNFTVDPPATLSITPTNGHVGSGYTVNGTGYRAGETVTVKFNCGVSGCSSTQVLGTPTATSSGTFSLPVTIPSFSIGTYPIGALGGASNTFSKTTFTIN